jgi:hypothetical protein
MQEMFEQLGTSPNLKRAVDMPKTGNHVMGSYIKSNDVEGVERETENYGGSVGIEQSTGNGQINSIEALLR